MVSLPASTLYVIALEIVAEISPLGASTGAKTSAFRLVCDKRDASVDQALTDER